MWLDDLKDWTKLDMKLSNELPKTEGNGGSALGKHVNLLQQKTTADDNDE